MSLRARQLAAQLDYEGLQELDESHKATKSEDGPSAETDAEIGKIKESSETLLQ